MTALVEDQESIRSTIMLESCCADMEYVLDSFLGLAVWNPVCGGVTRVIVCMSPYTTEYTVRSNDVV